MTKREMKMGLFGSKAKAACTHPAASQIWQREDKTDRYKTTGVKCAICGKRFPPPAPGDNRPPAS